MCFFSLLLCHNGNNLIMSRAVSHLVWSVVRYKKLDINLGWLVSLPAFGIMLRAIHSLLFTFTFTSTFALAINVEDGMADTLAVRKSIKASTIAVAVFRFCTFGIVTPVMPKELLLFCYVDDFQTSRKLIIFLHLLNPRENISACIVALWRI